MAAGEAQWQIENVETHIRLLKNQLHLMEDEFPAASIDKLIEHGVAAKVRRQTFDGYSPLPWWFGTQCAREVEEHGLGENPSSFERRLEFQTAAQAALVRADARKTLRLAQYARVDEIFFEGAKVASVAVVIVVLVERWFSLVLQEC